MMDFTANPGFIQEQGYCVYEHIFPDGKRYIGITKDAKKRWGKDGHGYDGVPSMREAISKTGWDNIKHNIIVKYLQRSQAQALEKYLIKELNAIDDGYNQRTGGQTCKSLYSSHVTKMLSILRSCPYPGAKEFSEFMDLYSEDEPAAYMINLIDYVLRTEVPAFMDQGEDRWLNVAAWVYYMKNGIIGKDVRAIPSPQQFAFDEIMKVSGENDD